MKYQFLFFLTFCSFLFINISDVFSQNNRNNKILKAWNLIKSVKAIDKNRVEWKNSLNSNSKNCISGDCINGYGAYFYNGNLIEGDFKNGLLLNSLITYNGDYFAEALIDDVRILKEGKFYKLEGAKTMGIEKRGFTLAEILFFQELVYNEYYKCNCLKKTDDHQVGVNYVETYEIVNGWNQHVGYKDVQKYRYESTIGLKNTTNVDIYVRAYSKRRVFKFGVKNNPIEYFDSSFILPPGKTMEDGDFNYKPIDNKEDLNVEKLESLGYNYDKTELTQKGYAEYIKYVGQYVIDISVAKECNLNTRKK